MGEDFEFFDCVGQAARSTKPLLKESLLAAPVHLKNCWTGCACIDIEAPGGIAKSADSSVSVQAAKRGRWRQPHLEAAFPTAQNCGHSREVQPPLLIDHDAESCVPGFDQSSIGSNHHLFGNLADCQREVNAGGSAHRHFYTLPD